MGKIIACAIIALVIILPNANVKAQTLPDLVQKVKASVAFVSVRTDQGQACGSAFVVDSSGILITALHVVADAQTVSVQFPGASLQPADAVAVDTKNDLAALRVAQRGLTTLPLADISTLKVGQDVILVGYPRCDLVNADASVARGIVSGMNRIANGVSSIQLDIAMAHGESGGPVLTTNGEVIGVVDQGISGGQLAQSLNFAVSTDVMESLVATATDPTKSHSSLALPLQITTTAVLNYKGSANVSGKTSTNVTCVSPPSGALSVSGVHGELHAGGALLIKTWLSLQTDPTDPPMGEFGILLRSGPVSMQQNLPNLPPRAVCLNYVAQGRLPGLYGFIPVGFEVKYTVDYKIWSPEVSGIPLPQPATSQPPPPPAPTQPQAPTQELPGYCTGHVHTALCP